MSMQLYIIYNSITLDFQADGYKLVDGFYPETPDEGAESISDRFNIWIRGSSPDDLHSKITAIRLALEHAKRHKDDALAARIYYEVDNSNDAWTSKLLNGEVLYDRDLGRNWRHGSVLATIIIERKPYWDAKDEIQVPLTNGNGTNVLTALPVYNHDDGGGASPAHHDNWVEIAAADVLGDLLGPTRLEAINTFASSRLFTLWIGQNWTDPANFVHILEGESSTTGTATGDSFSSGAFSMKATLASAAEATMFTWALTDAFLDACQGQYFKFLARFQGAAHTNVKYRIKLQYSGTTIWQSGQVILDTSRAYQIRDLFTLRLPPWLLGQTNLKALTMIMTGQAIGGTPIDVYLDFLQITPLDGWRMLECAGYGVVQNSRMVDDGFNETAYIDNGAGDDKAGILVGYGNPIALYPGKKQRLYFLMHSSTGDTAEILRTISVKLFYHPRRKTL
jgi:hypothetical protein